jgi:Holliday junction resolvasome RuvABC endonuclease subunit
MGRRKAPQRAAVSIKSIAKVNRKRVLSIDPSSHSLGWAVIQIDGGMSLIDCGKIQFPKSSVIDVKFNLISSGLKEICSKYNPGVCVIEQSVYIQNFQTSRIISYIIGYSWGVAQQYCKKVIDINPLIWKRGIGYRVLSKEDKIVLKSESKKKKERKDRVREIAHKYFKIEDEKSKDDDIIDAIGIGLWYCLMKGGEESNES